MTLDQFTNGKPFPIPFFLNKSTEWKYEQEWRMFMNYLSENEVGPVSGLRSIEPGAISHIYLGLDSTQELENSARTFCKRNPHIKLMKAGLENRQYKLYFQELMLESALDY